MASTTLLLLTSTFPFQTSTSTATSTSTPSSSATSKFSTAGMVFTVLVWGFIAFCGLGVMFFFCSGIGWCGLGYCCQLELWRYVLVSLVRLPVRVISWIVSKIGKWLRSGSEWLHRTKVSCDGKMMKWRGERKAKPTDEEKTIGIGRAHV